MKFRVSPQAVCRQLLAHLKNHKALSDQEEAAVLYALKECGVPNATERVLAGSARTTLQSLLGQLR